jgi:Ca-activated chloride channel homolog
VQEQQRQQQQQQQQQQQEQQTQQFRSELDAQTSREAELKRQLEARKNGAKNDEAQR